MILVNDNWVVEMEVIPVLGHVNHILDSMVSPSVALLGKRRSAFQTGGYIGLTLGIILTLTLVTIRGFLIWVQVGAILTTVGTFFGLAIVTRIINREESLTYYHHQIAILFVVSGYLWLLRRPILPYLEITLLGVGIFLFSGRIGCFMVGCCHGRPHKWGVCYTHKHAIAGFSSYLVGVRLFPIQLVESLAVLLIVTTGVLIVLNGGFPGVALAWYVIAYSLCRFFFEFLRGDRERPYRWGYSEAQWTSLFLMLTVIGLEIAGVLPFYAWHLAALFVLLLVMAALFVRRRLMTDDQSQLLHPQHIHDLAQILTPTASEECQPMVMQDEVSMRITPLGLRLSSSKIRRSDGNIYLYGLSLRDGSLTEKTAARLAELILLLKHPGRTGKLIKSDQDVYHLVVKR